MVFKMMSQTILGRLRTPLKSAFALSVLSTGLLIGACGQKGPLTLPSTGTGANASANTNANAKTNASPPSATTSTARP
jgi:predicted small lipoprotein YifL